MPLQPSGPVPKLLPRVTIGVVAAGIIANLASGPRPDQPALAVPTAFAYLALALLLRLDLRGLTRARILAATTAAFGLAAACALVLADRWGGVLDGRLDAALRLAELGAYGFNGHVSSKSLMFIGICALTLPGVQQGRALTTLLVLGLLAMCNIAVVDLAMAGALWDRDLSVWSTLAAFSLTLGAALRLRESSLFAPLFLPGAAGHALRLMAAMAIAVPMGAGWSYAWALAPTPDQADLAAQLFGGLGWVMFQMTFLLGIVIARSLRETERISRLDPLTGLMNRAGLAATVQGLRADVAGVMLCDIAGFKALNEEQGHPRGDALLCELAGVIRTSLANSPGVAARLWGDTFLILVPNLTQPHLAQRAEALRRAVAALPPLPLGDQARPPALSIGCATFIPATMTFDSLLHDADSALHWVKRARRDAAGATEAPTTEDSDTGLTIAARFGP